MTKMGRKPYQSDERTRAQVKTLAGMGVPDYDIAKVIGISGPTMRKYYMAELETGHIEANARVAQSLYAQATSKMKPSVAAAIFWLKCRAGWREEPSDEAGKKETAALLSKVADKGTDWEGLLQ